MASDRSSGEDWCEITAAMDLTATRPKTDKKLYRLIELDNGLEVSDPRGCAVAFRAAVVTWLPFWRRLCSSRLWNCTDKREKVRAAMRS